MKILKAGSITFDVITTESEESTLHVAGPFKFNNIIIDFEEDTFAFGTTIPKLVFQSFDPNYEDVYTDVTPLHSVVTEDGDIAVECSVATFIQTKKAT